MWAVYLSHFMFWFHRGPPSGESYIRSNKSSDNFHNWLWKKVYHNFPVEIMSLNSLFCPSTQRLLIYYHKKTKKSSKSLYLRSWNQQMFDIQLEKWKQCVKIVDSWFSFDWQSVAALQQIYSYVSGKSIYCLCSGSCDCLPSWKPAVVDSRQQWMSAASCCFLVAQCCPGFSIPVWEWLFSGGIASPFEGR